MRISSRLLGASLVAAHTVSAITLDVNDPASVKAAASTVAHGMMSYYQGNQSGFTPGLLPGPYYWWEAGAMMGSLIDYWYYTGDTTYNDNVMQAMLWQTGPYDDYMPPNQTKSLGNDDQAFWGIAAMAAAEERFPNPPADKPQWLALAQAVFNTQAPRWDNSTCGGGLRWQIYTFNNGYNYKNSISNGCFFNLAARLGAYTKNETFFQHAEKAFQWIDTIGLITPQYYVYDGSDDLKNCSDFDRVQWSYNAGVFLHGAAVMWNQTSGADRERWGGHVQGFMTGLSVFFKNSVMFEVACEPYNNCNYDQRSFKAYLSRWMAATIKVAPWTRDTLYPLLQSSAQAAAKSCTGGSDGQSCGVQWTTGSYDGNTGIGPVSNLTGGTSQGNNLAGTGGDSDPLAPPKEITTADRAGAGILTALILISFLGGLWWMIS